MNKQRVRYSKWLVGLYATAAIVLIPWIFFIGDTLPHRAIAGNWDVAWVGFDIFMLVLIVLTAILAYRRSARVAPVASSLATVLLIDSWFDVMTSKPGRDQMISFLFAALIEVPLAVITFAMVHQALAQIDWAKQEPIIVGQNPASKTIDPHTS